MRRFDPSTSGLPAIDAAPGAVPQLPANAARKVPAAAGLRGRPGFVPLAALLLAAAAALEMVALFYSQGRGLPPMHQTSDLLAVQAIMAGGFAVAGGLCISAVLLGRQRPFGQLERRLTVAGAVITAGIVVCDVGLVVSDFGNVLASTSAGPALWLQAGALVAGAGGAICGLVAQPAGSVRQPVGDGQVHVTIAWLTFIASVLLGVAFVPAWDRYHFVFTVSGTSRTLLLTGPFTAGTPAVFTVGVIMTAVAFAIVPLVAVVWRPARVGLLLSMGVLVVVGAQVVSAVVGIVNVEASQFYSASFPPQAAAAAGTVVHGSLTWWFDLEVAVGLALLVLIVARWWTPAGGSLFDSYPFDGHRAVRYRWGPDAPNGGRPSTTWIEGSTAASPPGTIGYDARRPEAWAGPPHDSWPDPGAPKPVGTEPAIPGSPPDWPR